MLTRLLLILLFITGCSFKKEPPDNLVKGVVVKCELDYDHYNTTYKFKLPNDYGNNFVTFETNVWYEPLQYNRNIYYKDIKKGYYIKYEFYKKRDIDPKDRIVEATVSKVIKTNRFWATELSFVEDGKKYKVEFDLEIETFVGNKMLLTKSGDNCNLVAWQLKYIPPSHSSSMIFVPPVILFR